MTHPKPDISDRDAQIIAEPLDPSELEEALATDNEDRCAEDWDLIELAAEKWLSEREMAAADRLLARLAKAREVSR